MTFTKLICIKLKKVTQLICPNGIKANGVSMQACIHLQLGLCCRKLKEPRAALQHFTTALDLAQSRHVAEAAQSELRALNSSDEL